MKKNIILQVSLATIFLCSICSKTFCFPLRIKDDLGRQIEISQPPQRIISLAPTHTEILFALGLEGKVVGVTDYCNYPPQVNKKETVGGFANPNIDKIISLKPDLIISFGTIQKSEVEELEKRRQKVFWIYPHSVKDILESFEKIGKITGATQTAVELRNKVKKEIENIQRKLGDIPEAKRPTIFRVMGLDPLGTIGADSFLTDVFYLAGGKNVFGDIKKDFFQLDAKTLIERNPDVIVIGSSNESQLKEKLKRDPILKNLTAVKNNAFFVIPCDLICRPGPRVAQSIKKLAKYLYPEKFSDYPQRIISLGPSITEELYLLGAEDKLIGCTVYCKRPEEAQSKEKVATAIDVNIEKVTSLKPDLVLATSLTDHKSTKKLRNLGIKVVIFPQTKNFNEICQQFLELARLLGKEREAQDIVSNSKEKVDSIKREVRLLKKPKVFVELGAKPLFTVTKYSFINDLIEFAGGINIAGAIKVGHYSREKVLESNPDVIIIVSMGIVGEQEKKIWQNFKTLNAAKLNRIHIVDSHEVCSPTPVSFAKTLEEFVHILHPTGIGK